MCLKIFNNSLLISVLDFEMLDFFDILLENIFLIVFFFMFFKILKYNIK